MFSGCSRIRRPHANGPIAAAVIVTLLTGSLSAQLTGVGAADAISRLNRPRSDSIAGNGIDTATGAFVLDREVLSVTGGRLLSFSLSYNSLLNQRAGALGFGWTHPFEAAIDGEPQGAVTVYWDRARRNSFRFRQTGEPYEPLDEAARYDRLLRNTGGSWTLTRQDGTIYEFGSSGRLTRLGNKIHQFIELGYDTNTNLLTSIREPLANRLLVVQNELDGSGRIQSITDAEDRIVYFRYDSAGRLAAVRNPVTQGQVYGEPFAPENIPDNNPAGLTQTIEVGRTERIGLVRMQLASISHQRPADVRVTLISPSGTQAVLRKPAPLPSGSLVFDGLVIDDFDGENPLGTWRLVVADTQAGSLGQLNGWRLVFTEPTDPTRYLYDGSARIVAALGPEGEQLFANQYDSEGRVTLQDDGLDNNFLAEVLYRETGGEVITTYRDRIGAEWTYRHDGNRHLLSVTDPLNNVTRFAYNQFGDRTRITNPLTETTAYQYDADGNLISVVDPEQNVITMTYDERKNLLSFRDPLGNTSRFEYDTRNNLTRAIDAAQNADRKTFSGTSQMTGNLVQDGAGINMTYANGMRVTTSHPVSGVARSTYDNIGRLTRAVDTGGVETTYEYDSSSRVIRERNALGFASAIGYDRRGRVFRTVDRRGFATFNYYDNNNNLTQIVDAHGNETRFEYDGENRLTRTAEPGGVTSAISYDAAGRLVSEGNSFGETATYEYDAAGRQIAIRDVEGVVIVRYAYNARGQKISETDALGGTIRYTYDAAGQVVRAQDAEGRETRYGYDALGRRTAVTDPLNRTARQRYLQDDVLSGIENPRGQGVDLSYDPANRLTSTQTSRGRRTAYRYNNRDQVTRETTPGGAEYNYTYDAAGRLATMAVSGNQTLATILYDYDESDNVIRVSRRTGSASPLIRLRRTFDEVNRIASYQDSDGNNIQYTYTASGKLATLAFAGRRVSYFYDAANRLIEVRDWAARRTRYTYNARGQVVRVDLPNGTLRAFEYDEASRVVAQRDMTPQGAVISEFRLTYDGNGMLTAKHAGTVSQGSLPGSATMTYDNDNRILTYNGSAVTYDNNGNMTRGPLGNGFASFNYDPVNRLTSSGSVSYQYDEEDRLIQFSSSAGVTRLLMDPGNGLSRIVARTAPGGVVTYYVYGLGLLYEETNNQIRVNHYDHNGNTIALSGPTGEVTGKVEYSPFGEIVSRTGDTDSLFLFGGQLGVMTDPAGLNYMRFRWYSPYARRFLSEDARLGDIDSPASLNRYSYAGNNPVNLVDPNGDFFFLGAFIAVGAQLAVRGIERAVTGRPFVEKGEEWAFVGELAGAAVAGGLTGGAAVGASLGRAVLVGAGKAALAGGAGNLVKQGIRIGGNAIGGGDTRFSLGDFAADVALSGVFGAIPAGKGAKAARNKIAQGIDLPVQAIPTPSGIVKVPIALTTFQKLRHSVVNFGPEAGVDFSVNVSQGVFGIPTSAWLSSLLDPEPPGEISAAPDHRQTRASARQSIYAGKKAVYGEHAHWKFYLNALQQAARPVPNNPTPALATF